MIRAKTAEERARDVLHREEPNALKASGFPDVIHVNWRRRIFDWRKSQELLVFDRLVVFQWKGHYLRSLGISPMDGLAAVAEVSLCFTFRHSSGTSTFGPAIAVAVERHARNLRPLAYFEEMTGAFIFTQHTESGKQRPGGRQLLQDGF